MRTYLSIAALFSFLSTTVSSLPLADGCPAPTTGPGTNQTLPFSSTSVTCLIVDDGFELLIKTPEKLACSIPPIEASTTKFAGLSLDLCRFDPDVGGSAIAVFSQYPRSADPVEVDKSRLETELTQAFALGYDIECERVSVEEALKFEFAHESSGSDDGEYSTSA